MKHLFLFRHAKSSHEDPHLKDFDRPLAHRGEADAAMMGKVLSVMPQSPRIILLSPARRTRQTWRLARVGTHLEAVPIKENALLYHADTATLLSFIRSQPTQVEAVAIVGHNPGFTELINTISGAELDNLPTAGIAHIEFSCDWKAVARQGRLVSLDYPKNRHRESKIA